MSETVHEMDCFNCLLLGLVVFTVPDQLEAVEGFAAAADCVARGNSVGEMKWSRDFEPLDDKVIDSKSSISTTQSSQ